MTNGFYFTPTDPTHEAVSEQYIARVWEEYHAIKEELASERSKRTQIEEMYDLLVANVAPLIDAAREFELPKNDDSKTIHKIRRIVKYL